MEDACIIYKNQIYYDYFFYVNINLIRIVFNNIKKLKSVSSYMNSWFINIGHINSLISLLIQKPTIIKPFFWHITHGSLILDHLSHTKNWKYNGKVVAFFFKPNKNNRIFQTRSVSYKFLLYIHGLILISLSQI